MSNKIPTSEILSGRILPIMLKLGWPIMVSAVLDSAYQLVDTFWLGRLPGSEGGNAVAGLQISFTIIWFSFAIVIGFAMAGTALVSQYTGADRKEDADFSAGQVLSVAAISGLLIAVLGIPFIHHITTLITNLKSLSDAASTYLRIYLIGTPFLFVTAVCRGLLSASGNSITPMKIALFTNILNLLIDPLLIFGIGPVPGLGIAGAAITSVISITLSSVISMSILLKGRQGVFIKWAYLIPKAAWMRRTFVIGLPVSLANCAESLGFIFLLTIIGWLPESRQALGGFGVGMRITNSVFFVISGLAQGLTVIIGQRLGASDIKQAQHAAKYGIIIITIALCIQVGIVIFFRESLIWIFVPNEPEMISEGSKFLLFVCGSLVFWGIVMGTNAAFNAAGINVPTTIISFCRLWVFRLPLCYVLGFILELSSNGVWYGMGLSNILTAVVAFGFFIKGKWKASIIKVYSF